MAHFYFLESHSCLSQYTSYPIYVEQEKLQIKKKILIKKQSKTKTESNSTKELYADH